MGEAIKTESFVGEDHKVRFVVDAPELPVGARLKVTIERVPDEQTEKVPVTTFFGIGKPLFATAREAVEYIRDERNAWDGLNLPLNSFNCSANTLKAGSAR